MKTISRFNGKHQFLSNFYPSTIYYNGVLYHSAEAAFQAQKSEDPTVRELFSYLNHRDSKKLGRQILIRSDWDVVRDAVMLEVLIVKFTANVDLAQKLRDTGDAVLIEGNTWGDKYWGVCNGEGENRLGYTLMLIRDYLQCKSVTYDRRLLNSLMYYKL